MSTTHILVIPFHGQGHLFPSIELCKRLSSSLNYKVTLVFPSSLSSSLPPHHPLFHVSLLTQPPPEYEPHHHHHHHHEDMSQPLSELLSTLSNGPDPPTCAIIDIMAHWAHQPCQTFNIPTFSFFTSSACTVSIELAMGKLNLDDLTPGESTLLPGLPEYVGITADLTKRTPPHFRGPPPGSRHGPPPFQTGPGTQAPWVSLPSIALMINTCDDLERPFIDYLRKEMDKPIFNVGPLLPEEFSRSVGSTVQDHDLRAKRGDSSISEQEVNQWLDSKPRGSVIYVSFGSEVGPSMDELAELAKALDESNRPFIWVIRSVGDRHGPRETPPVLQNAEFISDEFVRRVKGRGLVIHGWAPQLLILSHGSTRGFISHGGWNSTLEAVLRGVPLLMWPIRGDQHYNAKLVVCHLKIGLMMKGDGNPMKPIVKDDILMGMERLMGDESIKKEACLLASRLENKLSVCYRDSLMSFIDQISIVK